MIKHLLLPNKIICCFVIFLVLFQPVLFPLNILHLLFLFSIAFLWLNRKYLPDLLQNKNYLWFVGFNLLYFIYASMVSLFTNSFITGFYNSFLFAVELQVCVVTAFFLCKKLNCSFEDAIINAGLVQAIISIIILLIPGLQRLVISLYVANGFPPETSWFIGKRFFGLSAQLTFSMPLVQTILAIFILHRVQRKKDLPKALISAFLLLVSAFFNARSAMVILIIGIIYLVIDKWAYLKKIPPIFYLLTLGAMILFSISVYFFFPATAKWLLRGISEIFFVFTGTYKDSYFETLFSKFFFFPEDFLSFLFGTGKNAFTQSINGKRSDVGFVIDLWYSGLAGLFLKYAGALGSLITLAKKYSFAIFLICVLLVSNIKGIAFENNELIALISLYLLAIPSENNLLNRGLKLWKAKI